MPCAQFCRGATVAKNYKILDFLVSGRANLSANKQFPLNRLSCIFMLPMILWGQRISVVSGNLISAIYAHIYSRVRNFGAGFVSWLEYIAGFYFNFCFVLIVGHDRFLRFKSRT